MRRAFRTSEAAAVLGLSVEEARLLILRCFQGARDVLTAADLERLRATHRMGEELAHSPPAGIATSSGSARQQELVFEPQASGFPVVNHAESSPAPLRRAEALFSAALSLEERDPGLAAEMYTEAVAANPRHADAHVNLGRLLHHAGRLREAEAHYVAALVCAAADVTATFNLAVALEDQGRTDEALERYAQALALDPECVDAYFNLARIYERKGERLAAIRHLKDYRRLMTRRA